MAFLRDARGDVELPHLEQRRCAGDHRRLARRPRAGVRSRVAVKALERDWEAYVTSRLTKCPPPSPAPLLQEFYCHDMWQLLCVVVLMTRVSSWNTKHVAISAFFEAYPTPTAVMEQVVHANQTGPLRQRINPLGLFDDRFASLINVTTRFLGIDAPAEKSVEIDLAENKIRGAPSPRRRAS